MATTMQKGDTGVVIILTVYDDDGVTPWNLSVATATKQIILGPPAGSAKTVDATFTTDGTDGKLQYATVSGDIDVAGTWSVQAYWIDAGNSNERRSTVTTMEVFGNVE